ncbi:MAG: isoaspartyl peptidase/L-asparaginase [Pseudomonadota bacterium]
MTANGKKARLPALILHAGAGRVPDSRVKIDRARESLNRIADETFRRLKKLSALECVIWAVTELENDPQFNAGTGGKLQSDGVIRLTASIMDGAQLRFAGVSAVEQVKNPVQIARLLLNEKDRVLGGDGARAYARAHGFGPYNPLTEEAWSEWKRKSEKRERKREESYGTVGAVAVDLEGHCAAATSTGGKGMEIPGRMSGTASVAGTYASKKAAVSATGVGEEITELALAVRLVMRAESDRSLSRSFANTFRELRKAKFRAGAVGVDWNGNACVDTTTECIFHAIRTPKIRKGYP